MGIDDMETEFFGSSRRGSRPKRSDRLRAKREQRRQLQPLKSSDPGERAGAAISMVEQGIDSSAGVLLDFVRDERNSDVRRAVAQAVLTAPIGAHPDRPEAQLRDWALAEVTRHGDQPPAPSTAPSPSSPSAGSDSADAPAAVAFSPAPVAPIVGGTIPAALSPDDRWRTGGADPVRPRPAAAMPRPESRPAPPPPPTAPTPPVVGGTVGNGSTPRPAAAVDEAQPAAHEKKEAEEVEAEEVEVEKPIPAVTTPAPSVAAPDGAPDRPATWRLVKAHPVDIVVWEPADSNRETPDGEPETAQPSGSLTR